jgi:4-aminobutyrate aminotransferase-like enzyme/aminoglycoside phosphotransferase (APT) family kinase protein
VEPSLKNPTVGGRPDLSPDLVRSRVRDLYGIDGSLRPLPGEWDQNLRLDAGEVGLYVVKVANRGHDDGVLDFQNAVLDRLAERSAEALAPRLVRSRSGVAVSTLASETAPPWRFRVLTWLPGEPYSKHLPLTDLLLHQLGRLMGDLDRCLEGFSHPSMKREIPWDLRRASWISPCTGYIPDPARRGMVERFLLQYCARVEPLLDDLPSSVIHNDANDENVLIAEGKDGAPAVAAVLDYGDMVFSNTVNELAVACAYAIFGSRDPVGAAAKVAAGYHATRPLGEEEIHVLFPLLCMRLCVSVTTSARAAREDPGNAHRQISDRPAWGMLERMEGTDWEEAEGRLRGACGYGARPRATAGRRHWTREDLIRERARLIGPSLSLAYQAPLEITRGRGAYLFDSGGRAYLDCVNNVCHVGHCHPRVVQALSSQAAALNTNTRYLHPGILEYAARLVSTLPDPLRVCFFVNSGSEANELALRMARTHTGRRDVIVLDGAYHGNTQTLVDISPYKSDGPGGRGLPGWAHKVLTPDPYRGPYLGRSAETGLAYAEHVGEICASLVARGTPPALFICESIPGCAGQVVLPDEFLQEAFRRVRAAGGLCAVDEVQVGMGRVGTHMWAFETQGVVPDIVTMGKPIGNGHPLGAVVTTPEIARSFANGMEFFSTFGGNPVSMAGGMAVMDVMEEENLMGHARRMGRLLAGGFEDLASRHERIGDVRGLGLFLGVELVLDRKTREPASRETARLIEHVKSQGILLSAEGPHHNVLKIKPPLAFSDRDARLLLGAVDRALSLDKQVSP